MIEWTRRSVYPKLKKIRPIGAEIFSSEQKKLSEILLTLKNQLDVSLCKRTARLEWRVDRYKLAAWQRKRLLHRFNHLNESNTCRNLNPEVFVGFPDSVIGMVQKKKRSP